MEIPVIPNIHQAVLAWTQADGNVLDMGDWHKNGFCGTTHCWAGTVVVLAGEAGRKLEDETSVEFAAKQILKASSPIRVSPNLFYSTNERAMEAIIRFAEEEKAMQQVVD